MAKTRSLKSVFTQTVQSDLPNLLVAGCSYVWNNSEEHICTWPYYLKDIAGFDQVFDCSQSGGGPSNVFNCIINEITSNSSITNQNTLVIVMWPELWRTDVITETSNEVEKYHFMSMQKLNDYFCNLSIFNEITSPKNIFDKLALDYKKIVSAYGQEYESLLKIIALKSFLECNQYKHIFMPWKTYDSTQLSNHGIDISIINSAISTFDDILPLEDYTGIIDSRVPNDGHPTPDAHLQWTREFLIPLILKKFSNNLNEL